MKHKVTKLQIQQNYKLYVEFDPKFFYTNLSCFYIEGKNINKLIDKLIKHLIENWLMVEDISFACVGFSVGILKFKLNDKIFYSDEITYPESSTIYDTQYLKQIINDNNLYQKSKNNLKKKRAKRFKDTKNYLMKCLYNKFICYKKLEKEMNKNTE